MEINTYTSSLLFMKGFCASDGTIETTKNGNVVAKVPVIINKKDKNFSINIIYWINTNVDKIKAESYFKKGVLLNITGELWVSTYEDDSGTVKKYPTVTVYTVDKIDTTIFHANGDK